MGGFSTGVMGTLRPSGAAQAVVTRLARAFRVGTSLGGATLSTALTQALPCLGVFATCAGLRQSIG